MPISVIIGGIIWVGACAWAYRKDISLWFAMHKRTRI